MSPIEVAVRIVVDLLVRREYAVVESMTGGKRLSASEMEAAVDSYGRVLAPVPEGWWDLAVVTAIDGSSGAVHVAAPLWTVEEGRSDLTIELRVDDGVAATAAVTLLDVHVL